MRILRYNLDAMAMEGFVPNKNATESSKLDKRSIRFIKDLLPDDDVDCSQLEEAGTLPNIDGYLDFLCKDGTANERIIVQIKHLTYPAVDGHAYYDIPKSIYAYSDRHKGEVVIFIACDYENGFFYWKYIDNKSIEEFKSRSERIQDTVRYHFKAEEACSKENVKDTITVWKRLYKERMDAIKNEKQMAESFASVQRIAFNSTPSELHGLKDSHIPRPESEALYNWILEDLPKGSRNICLLVGDAGTGKSVVIKDLIATLEKNGVNSLCIKADAIDETNNPISLETVYETIAFYAASHKSLVFVIDQIDALSQSLSADRNRLNTLIDVLKAIGDWSDVRAVVSCRKYDLEFDAVLSGLKENSSIVELGLLSEDVVKTVLLRLNQELVNKISPITLSLLRNVQYLNSYCFLYQRNKRSLNFSSPIELYDALWDSALNGLPSTINRDDTERVLFSIAECIKQTGTLKPIWQPVSYLRGAFEYLASNGLIIPEGRFVSFFHQTFYDYALARYYITQNKSFISDLENEFQGLEIRSTVKAVLEYNRGHNDSGYALEIQKLMTSERIRLHIKLLAISTLATSDDPRPSEKRLVKQVCYSDERILNHFFRGVQGEKWYRTAFVLLKAFLPDSLRGGMLLMPMLSTLTRYSFQHPDDVFLLIDSINDKDTKAFARSYVLRGHNDYRNNKVIEAFRSVSDSNSYFIVSWIQDALQSNEKFGLEEAGELLLRYLESGIRTHNHDGYELVDVLFKNLSQTHPRQCLFLLNSSLIQYISKNSSEGYHGFTIAKSIDDYSSNEYLEKIIKLYEQLLLKYSSDQALIIPIVDELLSLNNETSVAMALLAIAEHPELHNKRVESLLASSSIIEKYLQGSVEFYFMKMLKSWYSTLNSLRAHEYQRLLLSYVSSSDMYVDRDRRYSDLLFPNLWREKWELICNTLPDDGLLPEMKKCMGELFRRFGRKIVIERDRHSVTMAVYCGGITDSATYAKFSTDNWLSSFLKLDETKHWHSHAHPIDLNVHADAFKKCVSSDPDKFKDFVFDIARRDDIRPFYIISGIEGLFDAGVSIDEMWPLAKKYISVEYASENSYSFKQITGHYCKSNSLYIDEIVPVIIDVINMPVDERLLTSKVNEDETKLDNIVNNMINRAINSKQGRAIELLIQLTAIPERRQQAYDTLLNLVPSLNESLRTLPMHYLYVKEHFDANLYFPLLKKSLEFMGSEALPLRADAIQWCFYHKPDVVSDYVNKIEKDCRSHNILSLICFYGLSVSRCKDVCEEMLERILTHNDENVIAEIIKVSIKMFNDPDYTLYSKKFLECYSSDGREAIIDAFCLHCDELPVEAFTFYREWAKSWKMIKHRDIYSQLEYVTKCISSYPVECYKFIQEQVLSGIDNEQFSDEEVVKVLLKIYGRLKEDEDEESLNEIIDMFDEYIFRGNRVIYSALDKLN